MLWSMALGSLRREGTVTITLAGLIMLSVLLATSGGGLMARLAGAGESLLDRADAPHVAQMHAGELDPGAVAAFAEGREEIISHRIDALLGIDGADLAFDGVSQAGSVQQNSLMVPHDGRDLLLDLEDRPLTEVARGTIWLPVIYRIEDGLEVGSTVTITAPGGYRLDLTVAGFVRDSIMNTAIASSKRLAVNPADLAEVAERTGALEHLIGFWVEDPATQTTAVRTAYQEAGLPAAGPMVDRSAFVLFTMISEGLVAGLVLLAAVSVLTVGLLSLRLALLTALERDRREIAVMRAIGISLADIVRLHLLRYGLLAAVACAVGLTGGLLLEPVMSAGLTEYVGPTGGAAVWLLPAAIALGLVLAVLLVVAALARRAGRGSAAAALRTQAGTGGSPRRSPLRLHRSVLPTGIALGVIALLRRGGGPVLLTAVFAVCAVMVVVPAGAAATLASPRMITSMGIGAVDLRLDLQHGDDASAVRFEQARAALAADPEVDEHIALVTTRHQVPGPEGAPIGLPIESGDHMSLPVTYAEGRAPQGEDEIALSLLALLETGSAVGGTLPVTVGGQPRELRIVGSYQDITHGGVTAKAVLPTEGEEVMRYVLGATVGPRSDAAALAARFSEQLPGVQVAETGHYREQQLGPVARQMSHVAVIAAAAAVALAVLMTTLSIRMLLAAEAGSIAIQRALGARGRDIGAQYLTRVLAALALGIALGVTAGLTLGQGAFNLLLEGLFGGFSALFQGTSRIALETDPALIAALSLGLAAAVTTATALTCRSIRGADLRALTTA